MRRLVITFVLILCAIAFAKSYRIFLSFSAGELSPLLNVREDLEKYQSGCSLMENMLPIPQGGAQKRPGTKYVATAKDAAVVRLLSFRHSTEQSCVVEAGNRYMRFYADGAQITGGNGLEVVTVDNIVAHWLLNDNTTTSAVLDDDTVTSHDGAVADSINTDVIHAAGKVGPGCFDFGGSNYVAVSDHGDLSFDDTADEDMSIAIWVNHLAVGDQAIITKEDTADQEWALRVLEDSTLQFKIRDESASKNATIVTDDALSAGWHFIVVTYESSHASWSAATAANYMKLYINGTLITAVTKATETGYLGMEDLTADVIMSGIKSSGAVVAKFQSKIDNVLITSDVLTAAEVTTLYGSGVYEIDTPYLTADLFELKYGQSADVFYITHSDYETRKLSRLANNSWSLDVLALESGPFRLQNSDPTKTIAVSATTGSVTLTAAGHSPFVVSSGSGHIPDGPDATDKAQTGALFKIIHPYEPLEYHTELDNNYTSTQVEETSWYGLGILYKGTEWSLTTLGTWTGTLEIQRNYTIGAAHDAAGWESVFDFASVDDRNIVTATRSEDDGDALYRAILTDSGDADEECKIYFTTNQTEVVGIVKITAVASSISATGTVLRTIASTDATYKWSEGAWSNYRGWPRTVAFFEDRLMFGGNTAQPDTIWGSATADYETMLAGVNDADAVNFTLTSRQVNVIQWMVGKDKLLVGTSGAEWTLNGSADEPLTPSNVKTEQHSTYGSANLQAVIANESILFFQRGGKRLRELAYNWESDSYVAPDMTILAKEVTGDGIVDMAFQQTPDGILWCIREGGEIATFGYERKENITAWSRQITDGAFESIALINGDPEDEVWVSVNRDINSDSTVRYIEYFSARDFGTDLDDAYYVDSGVTYDSITATTSITNLGHLIAEEVSVFGDSVIQTSKTVDGSGDIAIASAKTVQVGLPYTVAMRTMPLSWTVEGMTVHGRIKRISEVTASWYNSGDFSVGRDASTLGTYTIADMTTDEERLTFPPGYDRFGYIYVYQASPEPLTLLAIMATFDVE